MSGPPVLAGADSALLETLVREAPVAFAFYGPDLRYARVNRLLAHINGRTEEEHLGRRPSEILEPGLAAAIETNLRHVLATGEVLTDASFTGVIPATGEQRSWTSQWFPSYGPDGGVDGVAVIVVDITDLRRSEDALRRSVRRTERLQQATSELARALTLDDVARVVRSVGRSEVGARWGSVVLPVPGPEGVAYHGDRPQGPDADALLQRGGRTPVRHALRTGSSLHLRDRAALLALLPHDENLRRFAATTPERAWALLPLRSGDAVTGVLRFAFDEERELEHEERVFLGALAGQCGLAVARAQLYEREHRAASTLVRSLIPDRLPTVPGTELASRYLPGAGDAEVGGDWYDVFELPSGRFGLAVGDVMGKGVGAAAGMGRMRTALRALALAAEAPEVVLAGLDRLVASTETEEQIVTVVYAVLDPVTGEVVAGDAGHPPAVLVPAGGPPRLVRATAAATPLGLAEPRVQGSLVLAPGDVLLAYSDGLVESRRRSLGEGIDALLAVVRDLPAPGDLEAFLDGVVEGMTRGQSRRDDLTVLALRRAG